MDRTKGIFFFGLLFVSMLATASLFAQATVQPTQDRAVVAEALIAYGRAHDDPESIIAAAGILAKASSAEHEPAHNIGRLVAEALAMRPNDEVISAFAKRVIGEQGNATDDDDDDEKTRQAPAFLQKRPSATPAAAPPAETSTNDSGEGAPTAASPETPATLPAYEYTFIEISLTIGLLVFGSVLVGLQVVLMITQRRYWDDWSIKVTGLTLVITAGLLLIVAGYSEEQAAPMMGMLGTVAGYLLGKEGSS